MRGPVAVVLVLVAAGCLGPPRAAPEDGPHAPELAPALRSVAAGARGCTESAVLFLVDVERVRPHLPEGFVPRTPGPGVGVAEVGVITVACEFDEFSGDAAAVTDVSVFVEDPGISDAPDTGVHAYVIETRTDDAAMLAHYEAIGWRAAPATIRVDGQAAGPTLTATGRVEGEEAGQSLRIGITSPELGTRSGRALWWHRVPAGLAFQEFDWTARVYTPGVAQCEFGPDTVAAEVTGARDCANDGGASGYGTLGLEFTGNLTVLVGATASADS